MPAGTTDTLLPLDDLFPPGVAAVLSLDPAAAGPLAAAEAAATARFVPARLAEFRHGRDCARRALARLGHAAAAIPVGARREPVWPGGVVGSISHAGTAAAAAVAAAAGFRGLGIDLEDARALEPALVARIGRATELDGVADADAGLHARRLFAVKEAAYKALWPTLWTFLDFHDLEVRFLEGGTWRVESRAELLPAALAAAVRGRIAVRAGLLVATAAIAAGGG